ncbi:MAG: hypothetical protein CO065_14055 [Comamonadaceae bacterium CG_4_9_14_0_8_um_filter_57_21]|nr:MAG: hypothetical protein CO065_14055 [Comamonadaceae bacterium CG_4_9_14_0_8_um_filter_57_21]
MTHTQQIQSELRALTALGDRRNSALYAWLRWLVLLAAGFFSLMAGQLTGKAWPPTQLWVLKLALGLNAAGILCGAAALYGEVASLRGLALAYKERIASILNAPDAHAPSGPVVAKPHALWRASEWLCYAALLGSLVLWVAFIALL